MSAPELVSATAAAEAAAAARAAGAADAADAAREAGPAEAARGAAGDREAAAPRADVRTIYPSPTLPRLRRPSGYPPALPRGVRRRDVAPCSASSRWSRSAGR